MKITTVRSFCFQLFVFLSLLIGRPPGAYAYVKLASGQQLTAGSSIAGSSIPGPRGVSPNPPDEKLTLQADGNLVYSNAGRPGWATNTSGKTVTHAIIEDGNLVLFNNDVPVWTSDTISIGANGWFLYAQPGRLANEGSVGIYSATGQLIKGLTPSALSSTPSGIAPGQPDYQYVGKGQWQTKTLDSVDDVGQYASMALNSAGNPVIAYYDSTRDPPGTHSAQPKGNGDLKLVVCGNPTCSSGNTITVVDRGRVDITDRVGEYAALALDSKGNPVIAYSSQPDGLMLARCINPTCSTGTRINPVFPVGPMRGVFSYISLALDQDDLPWFSYSADGKLGIVECKPKDCTSRIASSLDPGTYNSIALVKNASGNAVDRALVSYYDAVHGDLIVAVCTPRAPGFSCTKSIVDVNGDVGQYNSLRLITQRGNAGAITGYIPFISYYDATNRDLKAVYCGNPGCTSGNFIQVLDSVGDVGEFSSTANSTGFTISYYDATNRLLKLASCGKGQPLAKTAPTFPCQVKEETTRAMVDTGGYIERSNYSSLVVGPSGTYFMSYHDSVNYDLKITIGVQ